MRGVVASEMDDGPEAVPSRDTRLRSGSIEKPATIIGFYDANGKLPCPKWKHAL